jgi:hypothetical protein
MLEHIIEAERDQDADCTRIGVAVRLAEQDIAAPPPHSTTSSARAGSAGANARDRASFDRERYRTIFRTQPMILHARCSLISNAERR